MDAVSGKHGDMILNFLYHYHLNGLRDATEEQLREYLTAAFESDKISSFVKRKEEKYEHCEA